MADQLNDGWGSTGVPMSIEAEEALLGALMLNPAEIHDIAVHLRADDFYILRHKYIWEAMDALRAAREPVDYITLTNRLKASGMLSEIGGPAYLMRLLNNTPTSVHATVYAHMVERTATRRRLMVASDHIKGLALNEELTIEQVITESETKLLDVAERIIQTSELVTISAALQGLWDKVDTRRQNEKALTGFSTGYPDLDEISDGLSHEFYVVAGRPSMGKTALVLNAGYNVAMEYPDAGAVAIFSMEMDSDQLAARLVAMNKGVNTRAVTRGKLDDNSYGKFVSGAGDLSKLNMIFDFKPTQTALEIAAKCRRIKREYGLAMVIIDGLWLMSAVKQYKPDQERLRLAEISQALKEMPKLLGCPVMAVHQLNRGVEQRQDKRPIISDLAESGKIEQDADQIWLMYRDEYYNPETATPGLTQVDVAKHRNGDTGFVELYMDRPTTRFLSTTKVEMNL